MAKKELKVYLDHHIRRDNLLYKRAGSITNGDDQSQYETHIQITDLFGERPKFRRLRKPDFQRATSAWTAKDCVDLLEDVLKEQVVPSVIMWLSPTDQLQYVLDGGHRISVLLAWIKDDWGDRLSSEDYQDPVLEENSKSAAKQVREELKKREIGKFQEYLDAEEIYTDIETARRVPEPEMDVASVHYAKLVRRWDAVKIGFPIQWVKGDYQKAEESFLKINKSGRSLSDWETKLVENRTSNFARTVMSIAEISNANHCWTENAPEIGNDAILKQKIGGILTGVRILHGLLFEPPHRKPIKDEIQPLMATSLTKPETKPFYLAELLTITEGKKGQKPEWESLIKRDKNARVSIIIENGLLLTQHALAVINNIYGSSPRSLALMPLVYFYNQQGTYVRSLLYGMLYWLNHGSETRDIQNRKLLFTAHRAAFEKVLIDNKSTIIQRIARRIGSGPEVTYPTARYLNALLKLLIQFNDEVESNEFQEAHKTLIETLGKKTDEENEVEKISASRTFRGLMKDEIQVSDFLKMFLKCEICEGRYHPALFNQIDHIQEHGKGGKTSVSNARNTHNFCNNNREMIEKIKSGQTIIELPDFENPDNLPKEEQLVFPGFYEEIFEEIFPEDSIENDQEADFVEDEIDE
jgi:Protein of unknown function DUF262/HNH endonuclease